MTTGNGRAAWQLGDEYNPDSIHIRASDENGHSWKGRIILPKHWPGWIEAIVQAPLFPEYRTIADFIRDAVYHRLHHWGTNPTRPLDIGLQHRLSLERMQNRLAASRDFSNQVSVFVTEMDNTCQELQRSRDHNGLARLLDEVEDEVRANFSPPYDGEVLERITYWRKYTSAP
jgi:hypothetical protein